MMHDKLKKLMDKKKPEHGQMSDHEKHAKMGVLHELKKQAAQAMASGIHHLKHQGKETQGLSHPHDHLSAEPGMHHVDVAANSEDALLGGLDKAKELVDGAQHAEPGDPLKGEIHPDEISNTLDQDDDGDEGAGDNYGDPHAAEHTSEDTEEHDSEHDDMSEEELNKKLEHLMALKHKMSKKEKK